MQVFGPTKKEQSLAVVFAPFLKGIRQTYAPGQGKLFGERAFECANEQ